MTTILLLLVTCVLATCVLIFTLAGVRRAAQPDTTSGTDLSRRTLKRAVITHVAVFGTLYFAVLFMAFTQLYANAPQAEDPGSSVESAVAAPRQLSLGDGLGMLGAALATGLSVLGAGYAVGLVGAAALGVIAEKPELFGRTMVFIGLAEGLAIYGLVLSILILGRL